MATPQNYTNICKKYIKQHLNYNSFSPSKSSTKDQHDLPCFHELTHFTLKPNIKYIQKI